MHPFVYCSGVAILICVNHLRGLEDSHCSSRFMGKQGFHLNAPPSNLKQSALLKNLLSKVVLYKFQKRDTNWGLQIIHSIEAWQMWLRSSLVPQGRERRARLMKEWVLYVGTKGC
ncbi:uncharacterized protein LOC131250141 [Magnolia sinica]|uniref:uncharacterized protein LOC131250141 n=1 Tax=Magnolia sinica TaxID=86752 RepID=UPI00265863A5|nr:uncharacterized protein LOC131250141 [Magnolia sinica]